MRFFLWTAGTLALVLAVLALVFVQVVSSQDDALRDSTASSAAPNPAPLTEEEKLDRQIATNINLYGQLVCDKLIEEPDTDINLLVEKFIATYGLAGAAPEEQRPIAQRLLNGASDQFCPDQRARIDAAFAD